MEEDTLILLDKNPCCDVVKGVFFLKKTSSLHPYVWFLTLNSSSQHWVLKMSQPFFYYEVGNKGHHAHVCSTPKINGISLKSSFGACKERNFQPVRVWEMCIVHYEESGFTSRHSSPLYWKIFVIKPVNLYWTHSTSVLATIHSVCTEKLHSA